MLKVTKAARRNMRTPYTQKVMLAPQKAHRIVINRDNFSHRNLQYQNVRKY